MVLKGGLGMTPVQLSVTLSIGSLGLGFGAWLFGIFAITTANSFTAHRNTAFSFSLCVLSLLFQLFEVKNRAGIGDYSAIEDTMGAVVFAAVMLVFVTIILYIVALIKGKRR